MAPIAAGGHASAPAPKRRAATATPAKPRTQPLEILVLMIKSPCDCLLSLSISHDIEKGRLSKGRFPPKVALLPGIAGAIQLCIARGPASSPALESRASSLQPLSPAGIPLKHALLDSARSPSKPESVYHIFGRSQADHSPFGYGFPVENEGPRRHGRTAGTPPLGMAIRGARRSWGRPWGRPGGAPMAVHLGGRSTMDNHRPGEAVPFACNGHVLSIVLSRQPFLRRRRAYPPSVPMPARIPSRVTGSGIGAPRPFGTSTGISSV